MRAAIDRANSWRACAYVNTGDLGNDFIYNVRKGFSWMRGANVEAWVCIGNHDEYEAVTGITNAAQLVDPLFFGLGPPFYHAKRMVSGDGTRTALCLFLDCNLYWEDTGDAIPAEPSHTNGGRVGTYTGVPAGGDKRKLYTAQLNWIQATLAANADCDAIFVMTHYPTAGSYIGDYALLCDLLQADGRAALAFCGHVHPDAYTETQLSTDGLYSLTFLKAPATQTRGCWQEVTLSYNGALAGNNRIVIDALEVHNFTNPGVEVINAPFVLVP
jgi:predicted phosphohydrolase